MLAEFEVRIQRSSEFTRVCYTTAESQAGVCTRGGSESPSCPSRADSHTSPARTLARRFQSETGLSFGAWRQQARVLEAMGRLGGGAPVTEVAFDLGYESVSAFSAMFHRATGASPSQFRGRPQAQ